MRRGGEGTIRQLPSGRWQVRYWDPVVQKQRSAPHTFIDRARADRWLTREKPIHGEAVFEFDPRGFFVYLLWGADETYPLYVGQSRNVLSRLGSHMTSPDRRHRVERVQVLRCESQKEMLETEQRLIALYEPELNKAHNWGREVRLAVEAQSA